MKNDGDKLQVELIQIPVTDLGVWTIPEAVFWVICFNESIVDEYRRARLETDRHDYFFFHNWHLAKSDYVDGSRQKLDQALADLWTGLIAGNVRATACLPIFGRPRVEIAAAAFCDLEVAELGGHPRELADVLWNKRGAYGGVLAYYSPRLGIGDVRKNFKKRSNEKAGRKHKYNYDALRQETYRLMDYHGSFTSGDPKWNGPEKLIEALQVYYSCKFNDEPARSTLQCYVATWLADWPHSK